MREHYPAVHNSRHNPCGFPLRDVKPPNLPETCVGLKQMPVLHLSTKSPGECQLRRAFSRKANGSAMTELFSGRKSPGSRVPEINRTPSSSPSRPHLENDNKSCFNPLALHLSCLTFWPDLVRHQDILRDPVALRPPLKDVATTPQSFTLRIFSLRIGRDPAFEFISAFSNRLVYISEQHG